MTPNRRTGRTRRLRGRPRSAFVIGFASLLLVVVVAPSAESTNAGRRGPTGKHQVAGDVVVDPAEPVQIGAVTPWVESEGEFQVRFVTSPSVPSDAQLTYTIHQALRASSNKTLRDAVTDIIDGGQAGKVLQAPVTAPLSDFDNPLDGSVLSIPIRSRSSADRSRAFLPSSGIHPVSLVLTTPDGPELWSTIVFLNHLPRDFGTEKSSSQALTVSLVVPVETGPVFSSGSVGFSIKDRAQLDGLRSLLADAPDAPLKVLLRGNAMAGLLHSNDDWAQQTRDALQTAFAVKPVEPTDDPNTSNGTGDPGSGPGSDSTDSDSPGSDSPGSDSTGSGDSGEDDTSTTPPSVPGTIAEPATTTTPSTTGPTTPGANTSGTGVVPGATDGSGEGGSPPGGSNPSTTGSRAMLVAGPFVESDTEALARAGARKVLDEEIKLGSAIGSTVTTAPLLDRSWVMDEHVGPASLPLIESMGFTDVIVGRSQITSDDRHDSVSVSKAPLRLTGAPTMRVLAYDDKLSSHLGDDSITPSTRSHDVVTSLVADWFDANSSRERVVDPSSVIIVQPTVRPEVIASLAPALTSGGPIQSSSGPSLLPATSDPGDRSRPNTETRAVALKVPRLTDGVGGTIQQFNQSAATISSFASMAESEPLLEIWRLRNAESLDASLSTGDVSKIQESIRAEIAENLAAITPPASRRYILGSRQNTIPLRFKNALEYPVELDLHARSPRLDVAGGEVKRVILQPGENVIDLPVVVRAPGESLLRLRLTTPEGEMDVASFNIPVQSTAISGVGAALSVVSVLFILLWWARTFRRDRREQARRVSTHPSTSNTDG